VASGSIQRLAEPFRALGRVWREPDLRRLLLALTGSLIGQWGFSVALAVWAYNRGGAGLVGVAMFVRMFPGAILGPLAGIVADRLPRARVMIACDLLRALILGLVALAVATGAPTALVLLPLAFQGILSNAFRPAQAALMPSLARTPEDLTGANAAASTVESVGIFAGPALGGVLLVATDPQTVFAASALTLLWSAALIARLDFTEQRVARPVPETPGELAHEAVAGFRLIGSDRGLLTLTGLFAAQTFVAGILGVMVAVTALDILGKGDAWVGYLTSALGVGGILGGVVAGGLAGRRRLALAFAGAMLLWAVPMLAIAASPAVGVAIVAMGVIGIGNTVGDVCVITLMQRAVPDDLLARVFAVLESVIVGTLALGGLVAPFLIDAFGPRGALVAAGLFLPVATLLARPELARIDGRSAAPAQLDLLRRPPLFQPLNPATLEQLAAKLYPVAVPAGEAVFAQGDPGDRYYLIAAGEADVLVDGAFVRTLHEGEGLGEIALLRDAPRTATITARTDLELQALDRDDFLAAVTGHAASAAAADGVVASHLARARPALASI
jgi:MFS family permease